MAPAGWTAALVLAILAMAGVAHAEGAAPRLLGITAEGGDFRAALSDGLVLAGRDLVGAIIAISGPDGTKQRLRIDSGAVDPRTPQGDVWLFDLTLLDGAGGASPFCTPDPDGNSLAIPHPGADGKSLQLTCSSGAVGKCFRFGYRPWVAELVPLHAACVRMLRGDYGGNDRAWTRNGMLVDVYDTSGIQLPEAGSAMPFEAGWGPDGAVCLAHPRVAEHGDLAAIVAAAPRLAGRVGADFCTEAQARALGAILFNRSAVSH